ncbi:MAG: hypothetical protein JJU12_03635 [Chlamydiales bacterium]|nr:hypothetical protein [Chlamydiales bacterium]
MACCIESTQAFFCSDNHLAKFLKQAEGQDKFLKFLSDGVFPTIEEIARLSGASSETMNGIGKAHSMTKLTRDMTGMLNIFRGVIPGMVNGCKQIGALISGVVADEKVDLKFAKKVKTYDPTSMKAIWYEDGNKKENNIRLPGITPKHYTLEMTGALQHNEIADDRTEMLLKLGATAGSMIGAATYTAGFGIARPAANVRKYFHVDYGDTGNSLANAFPYIMFGNHVGGIMENSFELAFQFKAYERAMRDLDNDPDKVHSDFLTAVTNATLSLIEKFLEILNDMQLFIGVAAPAWFKIPLGLGVTGLGLVRVWRKTT